MEVEQDILTVVAPIRKGALESLNKVLAVIGKDAVNASLHPSTQPTLMDFRALETIHFARWVVLPESKDARGGDLQACLLFSATFDEPLKDFLHELTTKARHALDSTFENCKGYPRAEASAEDIADYLRDNRLKNVAMFNGSPGRSASQIQQEATLRESIEQFLDTLDAKSMPPAAVRRAIQAYVVGTPSLRWALSRPRITLRQWLRRKWSFAHKLSPLLLVPLLAFGGLTFLFHKLGLRWWKAMIATLGVSLPPFLIWLWRLECTESHAVDTLPDMTKVALQEATEDRWGQNHFTRVNNIKSSPLRHAIIRCAIWGEDFLRHCETKGSLRGIESIHSASWSYLNGHDRLMFLSNYDGGWEDYIGDFIRFAWPDLNLGYSNTEHFPRTRFLIFGGVRHEQHYKAYLRNSQLPPAAWYSAYPRLSLKNINNNSFIRKDLWRAMSNEEVETWLRRF